MYTWEDIKQANALCSSVDVKGREYIEVNQRIKAFRSICPGGSIITEMLSNENGVCVFKAVVSDENGMILGTGTAYENEKSSFINKTSYIENCETSAVGRALGMCGFGIDTSIASAEEVQNAIKNQGQEQTEVPMNIPPRDVLIARLKALGIPVKKYAAEHGITAGAPDEVYLKHIKELENR